MNIGILLSGCGVYDGAEIQEAIFTMLAIEEIGGKVVAIGIDDKQHHVINHITGEEMPESRNMLVEAARISRGAITSINKVAISDLDAVVIPGGFGSAKNLTKWAFEGAQGVIRDDVKTFLNEMHKAGKYIVALCVSPVVIAKTFEGTDIKPLLTIGSKENTSPYNIGEFETEIEKTGAKIKEAKILEVVVDEENKIISAPCYMMDASLLEVKNNISNALEILKNKL